MENNQFSWQTFKQVPIIGIMRNISFEDMKHILPIYHKAGFTTIEVAMNTPRAPELIEYIVDGYADKLNIGAGTVCNEDDLNIALDAGAQFIVTPIVNKKVIRACVKINTPVFPGAFTPTEVYKAWSLGAAMVKIYPATSLQPEYISALKAPLDQIKLVPTGGVGFDNLLNFLQAGADGLGIGSQIFDKVYIREKNWEALKAHFDKFIQLLGNRAL